MSFNRFVRGELLDNETLDALYSENDMAARICDVRPDEELGQGYKLQIAPDADTESGEALDDAASMADEVKTAADALDLQNKMITARVWGRVFGGGVMLLGVDDGATVENGRMVEPLDENNITRFDHINVLDRWYVHPISFYTDPTDPKFGMPKTYLVTPQAATNAQTAGNIAGTIEIHESRMVVFGGTRTTIRTRQENGGWDTSVLQRINTTLTQYGVSWDSLAHMLQDASQGVFKMKGYIDALASNDVATVMSRLDVMDSSRSQIRALVLDEESEDFTRQNYSWSGIKDPYELLMLKLAAGARMPVTVLMGQSPAGLSATGESDIRWFYDTVKTSQTNEVKPALERVLRLIMLDKSGPTGGQVPESWGVTFPSLWQPTPSEQADIEKTTAEKDQIYIQNGVVTPEEVAVSRYTAEGFQTDTQINLEERRALLEGGLDAMEEETPVLDEPEVDEAEVLAGPQTAQMVEVAKQVQSGELDQTSGVAILVAAYNLDPEDAIAIVGEVDEEKQARNAALASQLAGGPAPDDEPEPEPEPDDDDPDDDNE
jgi:phage-related protein (TIGR01555 family)